MNSFYRKSLFALLPILFTAFVFTYKPFTQANAPAGFSQPYGLLVHNLNEDRPTSRIKALEVLLNYFGHSEIVEKPVVEMKFKDLEKDSDQYQMVYRGCQLAIFDCSQSRFNLEGEINQKDFLVWFSQLRQAQDSKEVDRRSFDDSNAHFQAWLEARRLNLLSDGPITYEHLQDFIYRYEVVQAHYGFPYQKGMLLDYDHVNLKNYSGIKEIREIRESLEKIRDDFNESNNLTEVEKKYIKKINEALQKFSDLEKSLNEKPYILHKRDDLPKEVVDPVQEFALQDVLYSYSYYYGDNAPYRQHNLITGTTKLHGKVYQPGDVIDYWDVLSDKNLTDFKYGWVIANGGEEWQFGGGICGSSSMLYLPAWKAGLEIVERKSHSKFYSNLYPIDQIGLDATVYRPRPNLKIRNNFDNPIVFNVKDDKEKQLITLEIIGNSKYKNVEIEGPIFITDRHIKWIRHMEDFEGNVTSETVESKYNKIYR